MSVSIELYFSDFNKAAKVMTYAAELMKEDLNARVEFDDYQPPEAANESGYEQPVPAVEPEPEPAGFTKDRSRGIYFYLPVSESFGVTFSTEEWKQVLESDGAIRITKVEYEAKQIRKELGEPEAKPEPEPAPEPEQAEEIAYTTAHGRAALQQIASQVEYGKAEQTLNEVGYGRISDVPDTELPTLITAARNMVPDSAAFDSALSAIN